MNSITRAPGATRRARPLASRSAQPSNSAKVQLLSPKCSATRSGKFRAACAINALGIAPASSDTGGLLEQVLDDLADAGPGEKDLVDAGRLQLGDVLLRNDAAGEDADVGGAAVVEPL